MSGRLKNIELLFLLPFNNAASASAALGQHAIAITNAIGMNIDELHGDTLVEPWRAFHNIHHGVIGIFSRKSKRDDIFLGDLLLLARMEQHRKAGDPVIGDNLIDYETIILAVENIVANDNFPAVDPWI